MRPGVGVRARERNSAWITAWKRRGGREAEERESRGKEG